MGFGVISATKNNIKLLEMGVLQLSKHENHAERLQLIFKKIEGLIKMHRPVAMAIEAPFFGKNVQSMLKLGRAQGVAIAAGMINGLEAVEYAPLKIKQSITGRGSATKEQVWKILQQILKFEDDLRFLDASDAVGVALCHYYQMDSGFPSIKAEKSIKKTSKGTNWESFIAQNPDRIKK